MLTGPHSPGCNSIFTAKNWRRRILSLRTMITLPSPGRAIIFLFLAAPIAFMRLSWSKIHSRILLPISFSSFARQSA